MNHPAARHPQPSDLASKLLANVRGATPLAIEQIDILLRLLTAANNHIGAFLCLGGDLAMLAFAILDEYPGARGRLLSRSITDVRLAREPLNTHSERIAITHVGEEPIEWFASEMPETFDAIVCGSILEGGDSERRGVFARCFRLLKPGGLILNVTNVASATRWTESVLDDYLIDAIFGEELRHGAGKNRAEIARAHFERATTTGTRTAPLEVQCDWLRELGFENVDCYSKIEELAVYGGQKPH